MNDDTRTCPAALNVLGEHFPCDWPTDSDGQHRGFAHSNADAHALWTDDPAVDRNAWAAAEAAGR
jgi:hypothetical protein